MSEEWYRRMVVSFTSYRLNIGLETDSVLDKRGICFPLSKGFLTWIIEYFGKVSCYLDAIQIEMELVNILFGFPIPSYCI